jgi:hypothetical protein
MGLIAIFLPGMLILTGVLPFWEAVRKRAAAQAVMPGVNAVVVGLLGAALYNPVCTASVKTSGNFWPCTDSINTSHGLASAAASCCHHRGAWRHCLIASPLMSVVHIAHISLLEKERRDEKTGSTGSSPTGLSHLGRTE